MVQDNKYIWPPAGSVGGPAVCPEGFELRLNLKCHFYPELYNCKVDQLHSCSTSIYYTTEYYSVYYTVYYLKEHLIRRGFFRPKIEI